MNKHAIGLLPLLLTACALGPNYKRPAVAPPAIFRGQSLAETASLADQPWWEVFGDPALKELIDASLLSNFDVRVAAWRVEEFRARAGVERSGYYPEITPSAFFERGEQSAYSPGGGVTGNILGIQAALSWELDLWGRVRRMNEAARAAYLGSQEVRRGVHLSTLGEVATAYFELRELDHRLEIARSTTTAFQETRDLFARRLAGGAASALETARAEAALAQAASTIPGLERQIHAQENLLRFLVGQPAGPIVRGQELGSQALPPTIPAGLPSTLLERRPDLQVAEQNLVAANAAVGVSIANYFPTFSLNALFGGLSPHTSDLFTKGRQWNVEPTLAGPAFQGLKTRYQKEVAVAQWEQARVRYQQAVEGAFSEVSNALVAYQKLEEAEQQQVRAVEQLREAVRLANLRYTAGLSSYLEVLDAQQALFPAENAASQARLSRLLTMVQLYKALGGGWNLQDGKRGL
jgi:multidrug efflux system outer membrane protein